MAKRIRISLPMTVESAPLDSGLVAGDSVTVTETLVEGPSWLERMAEQRKQWKAQDERRYVNPDKDPEAEQIWVVYAWLGRTKKTMKWERLGEKPKKTRRRKPMTMNRLFAQLRQSFGLPKETPVLLISLQDDRVRIRNKREFEPPKHHDTLRPHEPPAEAVKLRVLPPTPKRKVRNARPPQVQLEKKTRKDGKVQFTFKTRYVAWGRMVGRPWFFLGPCVDGTRKGATKEIKERFPMYSDIRVLEVKSLKYSLRSRIMDGRLRAGVSKDTPPGER